MCMIVVTSMRSSGAVSDEGPELALNGAPHHATLWGSWWTNSVRVNRQSGIMSWLIRLAGLSSSLIYCRYPERPVPLGPPEDRYWQGEPKSTLLPVAEDCLPCRPCITTRSVANAILDRPLEIGRRRVHHGPNSPCYFNILVFEDPRFDDFP